MPEVKNQKYYVWERNEENGDKKIAEFDDIENAKSYIKDEKGDTEKYYVTAKYYDVDPATYKPFN